jgi:hypothetical protein
MSKKMDRGGASGEESGGRSAKHEPSYSPKYTMRISRLTIDKLGIKLYDRVSAVLAELIANAYDADAEDVHITLPWGTFLAGTSTAVINSEIVVADNGHGMTAAEVNKHYLSVGSDRRARTGSDKSKVKDRPVMGRKGIGKLAPFGICQTIEVITAGGSAVDRTEDGWPVSHLILQLNDMLTDIDENYHPTPGPLDGTFRKSRGTEIHLRNFLKKRVPSRDELDRQLAARFGLQRQDWRVNVTDSSGGGSFTLGELRVELMEGTRIDVGDRPVIYEDKVLPVRGWAAYSKQSYRDDTMAGIRIFARGKLVAQTRDFAIGSGFHGELKIRSYLIGEIHADWLDDEEDLIRSDRQDIIWSSERGEALTEWGQKLVRELGKLADRPVRKQNWKDFKDTTNFDSRINDIAPADTTYRESVTQAARILVENNDPESVKDPQQADQIFRLALTLAPHRSLLRALEDAADSSSTTLETVVSLFDKARVAEMYSLGQVAAERVAVVTRLQALVADGTTLEQPLQELIEQAPWLLAPEWTPLGMNESLNRVRASFQAWYKKRTGQDIITSAIGSPRREPDFVLLNDSGVLWIVEIKRMEYHLTDAEYDRALNYLEQLELFLTENKTLGDQFPIRKLTFVVDHVDRLGNAFRSSLSADPRVDHRGWHEVLDATQRAHKDFLARVDEIKGSQSEVDAEW